MKPLILTSQGNYFNLLKPEESIISIEDIAQGLSHINRFNGQTRLAYSVAQHSVLVSQVVPPEFAFFGLLHDAAEAYIGDMTTQLKMLIPAYKTIEKRVEHAIFKRFGLPCTIPPAVKNGDLLALATEFRDLMPKTEDVWGVYGHLQPLPEIIGYQSAPEAKAAFMARYEELVSHPMHADYLVMMHSSV